MVNIEPCEISLQYLKVLFSDFNPPTEFDILIAPDNKVPVILSDKVEHYTIISVNSRLIF